MKLDIQLFGGRGASSSNAKWSTKTNQRMASVMSKLGISEKQYKENTNLGNQIYISVSGKIADKYEKETGLVQFGETKEYDNFVKNYDVKSTLDNSLKDKIQRLKEPNQSKIVDITSISGGSKYMVFNNKGINKEFNSRKEATDYIKKNKLKLWK